MSLHHILHALEQTKLQGFSSSSSFTDYPHRWLLLHLLRHAGIRTTVKFSSAGMSRACSTRFHLLSILLNSMATRLLAPECRTTDISLYSSTFTESLWHLAVYRTAVHSVMSSALFVFACRYSVPGYGLYSLLLNAIRHPNHGTIILYPHFCVLATAFYNVWA